MNMTRKLTERDVREIRQSRQTNRTLAARYGVSVSAIAHARCGRNHRGAAPPAWARDPEEVACDLALRNFRCAEPANEPLMWRIA